jgi:hypothetical protein
MLLSPRFYWLPESLPFLHLGETVFHPMTSITSFPAERLVYLSANVCAYWERQQQVTLNGKQLIPELMLSNLTDLPMLCCTDILPPLIRYPFLAPTKEKADSIYSNSKRYGLGVSRMYQKPLNEIPGLKELFKTQGPFPNSKEFADLLLTFPTHQAVLPSYARNWVKTLSYEA